MKPPADRPRGVSPGFRRAVRRLLLAAGLAAASLPAQENAGRSTPTRPGSVPPAAAPAAPKAAPKAVAPAGPANPAPRAAAAPKSGEGKIPAAGAYVGAREISRVLKAASAWDAGKKQLTLTAANRRFVLEAETREAEFDGVRVFLGAPAEMRQGELAISKIDYLRLLTPAVRPGQGAGKPPGLKTIVIDPGHGGRDTGKVNARLRVLEKEMTLDTARRLKVLLEAQGYRVVLTRDDDRYVELTDRPAVADRVDADLFLSLHFNAVEADVERVTGVEVYTMTPQHQLSANRQPDDQVTVHNPGNFNDHWNVVLGFAVHRDLLAALKVPDRGLKRSRFAVLRLARCPAVLIEAGFLSNDAEAARVATQGYRQQIAVAIAAGVRSYGAALAQARANR